MLDAWAVVAVLMGEPAGPRVAQTIASGEVGVSWINLGEAHYTLTRRQNASAADRGLQRILAGVRAEEPDRKLVLDAARLKARGGISYADCFAVATAKRHRAPLLTGDPEIVALAGEVQVIDLRTAA